MRRSPDKLERGTQFFPRASYLLVWSPTAFRLLPGEYGFVYLDYAYIAVVLCNRFKCCIGFVFIVWWCTTVVLSWLFLWCPCMAINVSVQYNGGLLPDIILLTQRPYHRGTRLNAMKRFCICSLWADLNILTFFPPDWGMLRRSRCVLYFLQTRQATDAPPRGMLCKICSAGCPWLRLRAAYW